MNHMIEIHHLYKRYKTVTAVNDLSFHVKEGEFFAFLGVNGAGKSTTISLICGRLHPDSGDILVKGKQIDSHRDEIKRSLGVVFQESLLDQQLTVLDTLKYRAALYGIRGDDFARRMKELSRQLEFGDLLKRRVDRLSGGQRRRIDIARALLHKPQILILDEPTTGLDPQTRQAVWAAIHALRAKEGITVFLTTHYMEEAADTDYVVILDEGQIAAEGTPLTLKNTYTGDFITMYDQKEPDIRILNVPYEKTGDAYRISVSNTGEATRLILSHPELFTDYEITKGTMDDVFLAVTGKKIGGTL